MFNEMISPIRRSDRGKFYISMCMFIFYHRLTYMYAISVIACINDSNSCNIPLKQNVTGKTEEANKMIGFFH